MQFKHPELLYALLLLLIPILVHLFQLRKFRKETFTNVAFLKKLDLQTRKSNRIKKWLILFMRLGVIAMAVLAFAQPFLPNSSNATKEKETLIYLDNSFSMQAKGPSGPLLKQAVQELIRSVPKESVFTLVTNTDIYKDVKIEDLRNTLLELPYSSTNRSVTEVALLAQKQLNKNKNTEKRRILISDFQQTIDNTNVSSQENVHYVQLSPTNTANVSVDSLYIKETSPNSITLAAAIKSASIGDSNVSVSLFNEEQLLAKATAAFEEETNTTVLFEVDKQLNIKGKITIDDPALAYDNSLYFSLDTNAPINVLSINDTESDFLERLYNTSEFNYKAVSSNNLDYSTLAQYNLVVLNGLQDLPLGLANALVTFKNKGGSIFVILNEDLDVSITNTFLNSLSTAQIQGVSKEKRLVTSINYDHPIYKDVFDKRIDNFQYPSVSTSFLLSNQDALLSFQDGQPFITGEKGVYVAASRFDSKTTNFKNSPLIVPTLYNIAKESLSLPKLYYTVGSTTNFDVLTKLSQDEILSLEKIDNTKETLIPLQRSYANKVTISTTNEPVLAGIYNIQNNDSILQHVSYNYDRRESNLQYASINTGDKSFYHTSVSEVFDQFKEQDYIQSLWKWFVIFALFFLLMEMLILKYLK